MFDSASTILYDWTESKADKARMVVSIPVSTLIQLLSSNVLDSKKRELVQEVIRVLEQVLEELFQL